jgi:hypothetical protein
VQNLVYQVRGRTQMEVFENGVLREVAYLDLKE